MKIKTKFIWSISFLWVSLVGLAPAATSYGQMIAQERMLTIHHVKLGSYTDHFIPESSGIEAWMVIPFESSYPLEKSHLEEDIYLEPWMIVPFKNGSIEEQLNVEAWMTDPFATEEETGIEAWMTAIWI